jgi:hypothetical protein
VSTKGAVVWYLFYMCLNLNPKCTQILLSKSSENDNFCVHFFRRKRSALFKSSDCVPILRLSSYRTFFSSISIRHQFSIKYFHLQQFFLYLSLFQKIEYILCAKVPFIENKNDHNLNPS